MLLISTIVRSRCFAFKIIRLAICFWWRPDNAYITATTGMLRNMNGLVILLAASLTLGLCNAQSTGPKTSRSGSKQVYSAADVQRALEKAEEYRSEGKYEQALKEQIWFHKNALKYDPAMYGVRLSFALYDWVELGKVYPPALRALRCVRNEALATYKKNTSDPRIYGEVMSTDLALEYFNSAKSLFYLGRKNDFRNDILMQEIDHILQKGDLKWATDIVGDPTKYLDRIKQSRDLSATAHGDQAVLSKHMDEVFARRISTLLKAVAKVKGKPAALTLQKEALRILDTAEIRNALDAP